MKLKTLVAKGLGKTRDLWPDVRVAFPWIHAAAHILDNAEKLDAQEVERRRANETTQRRMQTVMNMMESNPNAFRRKPVSVEDIVGSRMLNYPLTQYMFCSPAEGGVALVVCREDHAHRYTAKPVFVAAAAMRGIKSEGGWGVIFTEQTEIGPHNPFSSEKLGVVLRETNPVLAKVYNQLPVDEDEIVAGPSRNYYITVLDSTGTFRNRASPITVTLSGVTVVCPRERGPGWLTIGSVLIETERLP